jgi:hypothetical protein
MPYALPRCGERKLFHSGVDRAVEGRIRVDHVLQRGDRYRGVQRHRQRAQHLADADAARTGDRGAPPDEPAGLPPAAPGTRAIWLWTGAEVDAATRTTYSFAGIAVHHYEAWRDLPA